MDPSDTTVHRKRSKDKKKEKEKSKKRERTENGAELESGGSKKQKLANGEAQRTPTEQPIWKNESSSKWSSKLYSILWEKLVLEGQIFVLKCSEDAKCSWTISNLDGSIPEGSSAIKASSSDAKIGHKCSRSPLEHRIAWHSDVERLEGDGVAIRIQRLFSLVRASRWMCTTFHQGCNTLYWTYLMITRIQQEIESFQEVMKSRPTSKVSQPMKNLLSSLSSDMSPKLSKISVSLKIASTSSPQIIQPESLNDVLQTRLLTLATIDNLYYLLFHYALLSPLNPPQRPNKDNSTKASTSQSAQPKPSTKRKFEVLPPTEYFKLFNDPVDEQVSEMMQYFWNKEIDLVTRKRLIKSFGTFDEALSSRESNPLLCIWYLKLVEYIRFAYITGLATGSRAMEEVITSAAAGSKGGSKKASKRKRVKEMQMAKEHSSEPLCDEALQTWRDASRDWPSLLYAYAVPSQIALETIAKYGPVVEIGAGTGYWASLLKNTSIPSQNKAEKSQTSSKVDSSTNDAGSSSEKLKVVALDLIPPTLDGEQNEFHANVPPFCTVQKAGIPAIRKFQDHALFLCFPPPDDMMALDALRTYNAGKTVIHIGEWEGFTGSSEFESYLFKHFELIEKVELPNWQDTCYDLTVWRRRTNFLTSASPSQGASSTSSPIPSINTKICANCEKKGQVLRRCRCCRIAAFCSKSCASFGAQQHKSIHHLQGVFIKDLDATLDYNQTKHYRVLRTNA